MHSPVLHSASSSGSSSPSSISLFYSPEDDVIKHFAAGQPRSLSGIAIRAFCLGSAFTIGTALGIALPLLYPDTPFWRPAFFLAALAAFHFLEFWTTAARNHCAARVDSFLLTANWPAYAIAHAAAFAECTLVGLLWPDRHWPGAAVTTWLGFVLVLLGQAVRSAAMLHAGTSFNHQIQTRKSVSHCLVTSGIYSRLRHPSYFGFFYWSLGTQLAMGNVFCFFAYTIVLWSFFHSRIRVEEAKLVEFFGQDYLDYRKRVGTSIPFVG
ncbi:hypothetical protein CDD82_6544 [Ophiocordyceps australis]|uniref:Protein-S-isoprenylcysteine O-methyltransferase n=1 Tax=Ophiocordyceps australis TaxID=1399860 RepID=A0A2C5XZU0_9HYPO|nr:hypothetical protein CDD82_6544 [Ophiocordyceps australis]